MKFFFFFLTSLTVSRSILVCKCHNFIYGVTECSNFILLHLAVHFFQGHLLKRLFFVFFPHHIFLSPLSGGLQRVGHDSVGMHAWVNFWAFYFVPLIYVSVLCMNFSFPCLSKFYLYISKNLVLQVGYQK